MLREVAEKEKSKGVRLKIVEKGGITVERTLMRSNPMASEKCDKVDCPACKNGGGKGMCHKGKTMRTNATCVKKM